MLRLLFYKKKLFFIMLKNKNMKENFTLDKKIFYFFPNFYKNKLKLNFINYKKDLKINIF
jgi:hypothetical protein